MLAICNCGHPGSMESLAVMLRAVGWSVAIPDNGLMSALKQAGLDTVLDPEAMARNWGGDLLGAPLRRAAVSDMARSDVVYVDVKAHRNGPKAIARWPKLKGRVLWYRINGGEPADVPGKGPELSPSCPVLTSVKWYDWRSPPPTSLVPPEVQKHSYVCWPPFARWYQFSEFDRLPGTSKDPYTDPICLVHNLDGWGYGELARLVKTRWPLRCAGGYGSPDGLLPHRKLPLELSMAMAMVHLKSNDAPGYSLYEALAAGCPVILPRRFNARCLTQDLFEEGITCLMFDAPENAALPVVEPLMERYIPVDLPRCLDEIDSALKHLSDPAVNRRIGEAGRERLDSLLWDAESQADVDSLRLFLEREFP